MPTRKFILALTLPIIALFIGYLITDATTVYYQDWQWRYGARVLLGIAAIGAGSYLASRYAWKQRATVLAVGVVMLAFSYNHILDLRDGEARAFGMTEYPVGSGEMVDAEWEILIHTDRTLEWRSSGTRSEE